MDPALEPLTRRERMVVAALLLGMTSNASLSEHLNVSDNTVRFHLHSIFQKLGVSDRMALFSYAWRNGTVRSGEWWPNGG